MRRLLPRRIVLDLLSHAVAWARVAVGPLESHVEACGLDPLEAGESALAVAARRYAREGSPGEVRLVQRSGWTKLERLDLPRTRPREARAVLRRRCPAAPGDAQPADALCVGALASDARESAIWLTQIDIEAECALERALAEVELPVDAVVPHVFALGALGRRILDEAGRASALLWIEADSALCVIVDRLGWRFSREIPLKYAGDRMVRTDWSSRSEWQEEEHQQAERLATELQRTFLYVEGQLSLGEISRLVLCGHAAPLAGMWPVLEANLAPRVETLSELLSTGSAEVLPELGAVLGIATLPASGSPNALMPRSKRERSRDRSHRILRLGAGLSVAASLVALALLGASYWGVRSDARSLAARWLALQPELAGLEAEQARRDRFEELARAQAQLDSPEPPWTGLLELMGRLAPPDVYVEELSISKAPAGWDLRAIVRSRAPSTSRAIASLLRYRQALTSTGWIRLTRVEPEGGLAAVDASELRYRFQGQVAAVQRGGMGEPAGTEASDG